MRLTKKILSVSLVFMLVFASLPAMALASDAISVTINGQTITFADQTPVAVDGHTLVPVRGVFEALGFDVGWDGNTQTATLTRDGYIVVITIGSNVFTTNGVSNTLVVPAQVINDRTMIPISSVLISVGYDVELDDANQTVAIASPVAEPEIETESTPEPPIDDSEVSEPEEADETDEFVDEVTTDYDEDEENDVEPIEAVRDYFAEIRALSDSIRALIGMDFDVIEEVHVTDFGHTIILLDLLGQEIDINDLPLSGDNYMPTQTGDVYVTKWGDGGWSLRVDIGPANDAGDIRRFHSMGLLT